MRVGAGKLGAKTDADGNAGRANSTINARITPTTKKLCTALTAVKNIY